MEEGRLVRSWKKGQCGGRGRDGRLGEELEERGQCGGGGERGKKRERGRQEVERTRRHMATSSDI